MTALPKKLLTPEEYLARERAADFKSEFYRGETFAMAVASYAHTLIKDNIAGELRVSLKGIPCRPLTSDLRVLVSATGLYTYPALVVVGVPNFTDAEMDTLTNPQVVIEVLSEDTERYDRGKKFLQYERIPSFTEYVLVSQGMPYIERFARRPDGEWSYTVFADPADTFSLATVDVSVPLAEVYRGVELPDRPLQ